MSNVHSCPQCGPQPGGPGSKPLDETDQNCFRCGRTDLLRPERSVTSDRQGLIDLGYGSMNLAPNGTTWSEWAKAVTANVDAALEADRKRKSAKLYASAYSSDGAEIEDQLRSWE